MTTLHQISTHQPGQIEHILSLTSDLDTLLLLGDACYQLPQWVAALNGKHRSLNLCVRQYDLDQRGLTATASEALTILTDTEWVSRTLAHHPIVSWK